MKKITIIAIICMIIGCGGNSGSGSYPPPDNISEPARVIIISGQSNAVGTALDDHGITKPANIEYFNVGEVFRNTGWGSEVGLWKYLPSDRHWVIIKCAWSGTSLEQWMPGELLYTDMVSEITDILDTLDSYELFAFVWMQGENDSQFKDMAYAYYDRLLLLIEAVRGDFEDPQMPIYISLVSSFTPAFPYIDVVRDAEEWASYELNNAFLFNFDDVTKKCDGIHYDGQGLVEIGRRYAEVLGRE